MCVSFLFSVCVCSNENLIYDLLNEKINYAEHGCSGEIQIVSEVRYKTTRRFVSVSTYTGEPFFQYREIRAHKRCGESEPGRNPMNGEPRNHEEEAMEEGKEKPQRILGFLKQKPKLNGNCNFDLFHSLSLSLCEYNSIDEKIRTVRCVLRWTA